ncbi:MAG: nicotinamidase [Candidatus Bathyarchaeota archaeon]
MKFKINEKDALIIVDVQRDFCLGGVLPVPEGDKVVPILNSYIRKFSKADAKIYAARDWHPPNHVSFKTYGGMWPPHCIQESEGAKFHPKLVFTNKVKIISKATYPSKESYSEFDGTELKEDLEKNGATRVFIGGLATDYCVKKTVLDALKIGFETILLVDATRGINLRSPDSKRAIEEMVKKGANKARLSDMQ